MHPESRTSHHHHLYYTQDSWLCALLFLHDVPIVRTEVVAGTTRVIWWLNNDDGTAEELGRRFHLDRDNDADDLTVPLHAYHRAYRRIMDMARDARREHTARMEEAVGA